MSMLPKGGDTIWGGLDWSPEKGHTCCGKKQKTNQTRGEAGENGVSKTKPVNYGRMISFGKEIAEAAPSEINNIDFRVRTFKSYKPCTVCDKMMNNLYILLGEGCGQRSEYPKSHLS